MNELLFCPLYSGSSGNAILISYKNTSVIFDAGVSFRKLSYALNVIDFKGRIDALILSHDHSDHTKCCGVYFRKLNVPIFVNYHTWEAIKNQIGEVDENYVNYINKNQSFTIGDIEINPFKIPHDAKDPLGFFVCAGKFKLSIATDLGYTDKSVIENIDHSDILLLESNHDVDMLLSGPYPYHLKQRIRGERGHLSNEQAAEMLLKLNLNRLKRVYLGHLSKENNHPSLALITVKNILQENGVFDSYKFDMQVAKREEPSLCTFI